MAANLENIGLPIDEFIKLPTTVDFNALYTERFKEYLKSRPYLRVGSILSNETAIMYTHRDNVPDAFKELGYSARGFYPLVVSPLDDQANYDSGITQIVNQPYLDLSGRGVVIGFIDTGIDFTKDVFKFEDGSTKILRLWDQTVDGNRPEDLHFGSVYTNEDINAALNAQNPFDVVPSIDEDGHGTFLASVAAGNETPNYIGAAPNCYIMAVKLRRANDFYIDLLLLPKDNPNLFESTDVMLGVEYIIDSCNELNLPVVICIGLGSSLAPHDGDTFFEQYISFMSHRAGYSFITAAGNESNAKHHTQGRIDRSGGSDTISIRVGQSGVSFPVAIFGAPFDRLSIGITSPTGEVISRLPYRIGEAFRDNLLLERTLVTVNYYKELNILVRFENASEGIWDITIFGDQVINGEYYSWLPITGQVSPNVEFLRSVPEYTIVYPATALRTITVGAYNNANNSLYVSSSWGPTRLPRMAPDLAAPGVNVSGIYPSGPGTMTGTSVAAAMTAGAAAILMEWGIVKGNMPSMDNDIIRAMLISGARRDEGSIYPNIKWGYGKLDLLGAFFALRESAINYEITS